jgi:hypothetical protein
MDFINAKNVSVMANQSECATIRDKTPLPLRNHHPRIAIPCNVDMLDDVSTHNCGKDSLCPRACFAILADCSK